jgi:zinc/manganese transport system permease protein
VTAVVAASGGTGGGLLAYHFMVNAYEAGTVVAVVAGLVGWFMVVRRQSFVGHTLAVVSFPGAAAAVWLGVDVTVGYFAATLLAAAVIAAVPRAAAGRSSPEEPAVTGTVQAFALAAGVLFLNLYGGFLTGVTGLLFGTFLGVSDGQVRTLAAVAAVVVVALAVVGRPLLFASVDPDVAQARNVGVRALSVVFLVLLGATTAEVSQITGALLVFALLVMPAAAAQQLTARPVAALAVSTGLAVVVTWAALAVSYYSTVPVGFSVTTFGFLAYVGAAAWHGLRTWSGARSGAGARARPPQAVAP